MLPTFEVMIYLCYPNLKFLKMLQIKLRKKKKILENYKYLLFLNVTFEFSKR